MLDWVECQGKIWGSVDIVFCTTTLVAKRVASFTPGEKSSMHYPFQKKYYCINASTDVVVPVFSQLHKTSTVLT